MNSPKDLPAEGKSDVGGAQTVQKDDELDDRILTLGTVGLFAAVILAFLGICLPLFLL